MINGVAREDEEKPCDIINDQKDENSDNLNKTNDSGHRKDVITDGAQSTTNDTTRISGLVVFHILHTFYWMCKVI